jgi:uncharacterized protein (TIGR02145 family)
MKKILILFTAVLITKAAFGQGEQLYADGTATDQGGNTFEWINYGTQDWTVENAEMVTYRDGTPIPEVTDDTTWSNLTTGAWSYYDNDPAKGKLYNWYAVMGIHDTDPNTPNKEFAPVGWHVPTDAEWTTLENYLIDNGYNYDGTTTGNKIAKSLASTSGWNSSTTDGVPGNNQLENNSSGFNAFPVGVVDISRPEIYVNEGMDVFFWSSTEYNSNQVWISNVPNNYSYRGIEYHDKRLGFSVRFVRDSSSVGGNGDILLNGTVSAENNQIKNVADPTEAQDAVTLAYINQLESSNNDLQEQLDNLETILQAQIDNLQAQIDALQPSPSVTDQDGNTYDYLTYGDQVWTVENAEMVTYRDGTPIPQVTDNTEWANLTTGAWCYYDNDPTKPRLYNWYAVAGIHDNDPNTPNKELAPEGWHVPSDAEWTTLENHLIANGYNYDGTTTGYKIAKAMASTTGWDGSSETGAVGNDQSLNNSSSFNAFPEGSRSGYYGGFIFEGYSVSFWCSNEPSSSNAWDRLLSYYSATLNRHSFDLHSKQNGFSVRFVKDN